MRQGLLKKKDGKLIAAVLVFVEAYPTIDSIAALADPAQPTTKVRRRCICVQARGVDVR